MATTPTSHDVARVAGVSQPTVSRALSNDSRVAESTRLRVQDAAVELGYVPSRRGRSLATRRTGQIAVVVSELANPFYTQTIAHVYEALEAAGQRMVVLTDPPDRDAAAERLLDGSVDGAIITTTLLGSALPAELARRGLPLVLLNREVDGLDVDTCASDNRAGARRAAEFLLRLGHRRIAAISGPSDTSTGRDREAGFREALTAAGEPLLEQLALSGVFSFQTGYRALSALLDVKPRPTAVFCGNDVIALGALNAARARGIEVPHELTIVGFDDIDVDSWELIELTTLRQDLPAMAVEAVALIDARIADPARHPRRVIFPTTLIERATHGRFDASA
jgi:LacI family transcriptional regulator